MIQLSLILLALVAAGWTIRAARSRSSVRARAGAGGAAGTFADPGIRSNPNLRADSESPAGPSPQGAPATYGFSPTASTLPAEPESSGSSGSPGRSRAARDPLAEEMAGLRACDPARSPLVRAGRARGEESGSFIGREVIEQVGGRILARQHLIDALSGSPEDPAELTRAVIADPSLSAHILRAVNSANYGLREPLGSVTRAVLYLGHVEVRNIIWKCCFADAIWATPTEQEAAFLERFWKHSFESSRDALALARRMKLDSPDTVATAALLHDVGKVIALGCSSDKALALYADGAPVTADRLERERDVFGIDHARLGAEAASCWGLPVESRQAIACHHEPPFRSPEKNEHNPEMIFAVSCADALGHLRGAGPEGRATVLRPLDSWWGRFDRA